MKSTCNMCGKTKKGYMSQISVFGNYIATRWTCLIPDVYLCESCLEKFASECGLNLDELQKEYESNRVIQDI